MPDSIYAQMLNADGRSGWMRLRTLVILRWIAVGGQAAAVIFASQALNMRLPLTLCGVAIFASVVFNVLSMQFFPPNARLSDRAAMSSMLFDVLQVSVLLYLTGGLTNPFVVLLLAPVTVSAGTLGLRSALAVAATAFVAIGVMGVSWMPLAFEDGTVMSPPRIYIFGVWVAMSIGVLFMAIYARRVGVENHRMTQALNAAQRALASEQRLTAIGGLAAAAAHELGTPLATIKLVSAELADELADDPELREDAELIRKQADRCREILDDLRQGGKSDEHVKSTPFTAVIEEAAEPHADRGARIIIRVAGQLLGRGATPTVEIRRSPEIVHGLRNLVQNAVDFAETTIWIDVSETETSLRLVIGDDGPGYPTELIDQLGDPYIRSRTRTERLGRSEGDCKGMGLGLFIAKTLLERSGARVSFANVDRKVRKANRGLPLEMRRPTGATVAVTWSDARFERLKAPGRGALGENRRFSPENI